MGVQDTFIGDPTSSAYNQATGATSLLSELYVLYNKRSPLEEGLDYETLVQNILSALGAQHDLVGVWEVEQSRGDLSNWISSAIQPSAEKDEHGIPVTDDYETGTIVYEWWMGMQLIGVLLPNLSAFEIHHVASQSSVFAGGSHSHWILCTILCSIALKKCPAPLEKQWKRWQSLVCETIRLFQNHEMELGSSAVPLWTEQVLPACQHVLSQLPSEALHTALLSGLVGTASTIIVEECRRTANFEAGELHYRGTQLLTAVRNVAEQAQKVVEEWIFSSPWRSRTTFDDLEDEDVIFEKYKDDVAWWSIQANRHEKVAGMDTIWNETGIAILAVMAFDDRPRTLTPAFVWSTWFPHVSILLKASHRYLFLENLPTILLEKLFEIVPEKSLPTVHSASSDVSAPYEAFQLLSSRMMPKPNKKHGKTTKREVELDSKTQSEFIVGLMKSLLRRYQLVNQIKIVRKLVHDCPHPGLQAKFLDLLRPVIFEEECFEPLWSYIGSFLRDLLCHVEDDKDELVNTSDLINKVELYVGAITMVQLWCLVKGKLPKKIKGGSMGKFYKLLKTSIASWLTDERNMPPDDYYRLYLLEGALHQLIHTLDAARQKRKQKVEGVYSSSEEGLEVSEPTTTEGSVHDAKDQTNDVVVGDVDIFS